MFRSKLSYALLLATLGSIAPAYADYGYNNTLGVRCSTDDAANNTTLDVYVRFTHASKSAITAEILPSFNDGKCTVKLPLGYAEFKGIKVALVENIQTSSSDLTFTTINAAGNGQNSYTFTKDGLGNLLQPGTEYQFRYDSIFTKTDGTTYQGTLDTAYYSTSLPPVESLSIGTDGVLSWIFPTGDYGNMKADVTFYKVDSSGNRQKIVGSVRYALSDGSGNWDYYDFANDLRDGKFVAVVTAGTKKIYDSVDQVKWGIPSAIKFTTANGVVTQKVAPSLESADLAVAGTTLPSTVSVGDTFSYNLTTTNYGPIAAKNSKLTLALPQGVSIVSVPKGCAKNAALLISCNLGTLDLKQAVTKKISVKAITQATLAATITVRSDTADADPNDNIIKRTVTVNP